MKTNKGWFKKDLTTFLWAFSAVLLSAAPALKANVTVETEQELDINYDVGGFLYVYGTANLDTGAYAAYGIKAYPDSKVNIHGGTIGTGYAVTVFAGPPAATVTVYGTDFKEGGVDLGYGEWTPSGGSGTLTGKYGNNDPISLLFYSSVPINLALPGTSNLPPVAIAGIEDLIGPSGKIHPIYSSEQSTTVVLGQASDPEGEPIEYRWLEGTDVLLDWTAVTTPPEAYLDLSTLAPFSVGDHTLVLEVRETTGTNPLTSSDDMVLRILPIPEITIDIKPGSYPNAINLGSNGVIPVAILSTPDFLATGVDPDTVFLAGSGVAVRGKGNKLLASEEDVNGDGLIDLVIKVETENLDPGQFQDGSAILKIHETADPESTVLYQGSDEITIVPPE